ncbi:hypothetical protein ELH70_14440 [Rhizobium ruizarguesonis]|uniref:DEAD/DEAH box helicase n=1 Tax=Rhizobium ruizarguesonis TaxID=2081791 RepID=UPI001031D0F1|nr:DEAD/DEAH box helicase [Rhizobium ruizarguesonis]TAZ73775.1 hypothetical protein ELH70_14440 [Rhizobium ruizarguesonis]TBA00394.1 hypothetical protein ELH69_13750 [Rhizobium ruizarguesonis]
MTDFPPFDPYHSFIASAHALRRRAERDSPAMGATNGVAAHPLPFQLSTVNRILTDIRIRHLIADEVGLGKTIQAIMILNALAARDPTHSAVIVAPERLLGQWHEELWTRGHILGHIVDDGDRARMSAFREYLAEGTDDKGGTAFENHPAARFEMSRALLLRPSDVIDQPEWLDPSRHSILIIDEPQSIQREALSRLQQMSNPTLTEEPTFLQLLVLSATPRLGDPTWRDVILDLIEPEGMRLARDAGQDVSDWLDLREREAAKKLAGLTSDEVLIEGEIAFRRYGRTRRMSRQSRKDWGEYFPSRKNQVRRFDPLSSECGRLELIDHLLDGKARDSATTLEGNIWVTVRGLLRSRRSAREAIDRMEIRPASAAAVRNEALVDFGDSRLDALTDILAEILGQEQDRAPPGNRVPKREKIVIVGGDAGTIDMLATILPRYFPELVDGGITALKRSTATSESTFEDIREMHEALKPFTEGEARILLIGDWIQAGLNLQHSARNIIFYSLPWDPQAIDQLIGRIDRLSHSSIVAAGNGRGGAGAIRIWRLIMRHSPEEQLSDAFDALGVFERPLPQVPEESLTVINRLIVEIVTSKRAGTDDVLRELCEIRDTWRERGFASQLAHFDPLSNRRITSEFGHIGEIAASFAIAGEEDRSPTEKIELANSDWLHAVKRVGGYWVGMGRQDQSAARSKFHTMWYSSRETAPPFYLPDMGQTDSSSEAVHFLIKRHEMAVPPARTVIANAGEVTPRPIQFFDHGATLHDQLCQGWIDFGGTHFSESPKRELLIRVGNGHPALAFNGRPILISGMLRKQLTRPSREIPVALSEALGRFSKSGAATYLAQYHEALEADERWLAQYLPSQIAFRASCFGENGWERLDAPQTALLLRCATSPRDRTRIVSRFQAIRTSTEQQCSEHRRSIQSEFDHRRKVRLGAVVTSWKSRLRLIQGEADDLAEIFENRSQARAQITSAEMAAATLGRVEADLRRATLMRLRSEARRSVTAQLIRSVIAPHPVLELHSCMRFIELI